MGGRLIINYFLSRRRPPLQRVQQHHYADGTSHYHPQRRVLLFWCTYLEEGKYPYICDTFAEAVAVCDEHRGDHLVGISAHVLEKSDYPHEKRGSDGR
jgi:hypothetical protein